MLSREYLISRKECCGEGCLMCPYIPKNIEGSTEISLESEHNVSFGESDND